MAKLSTGFATLVASPEQLAAARLMLDSLKSFGEEFATSPVWVFDSTQDYLSERLSFTGVEAIPLALPKATQEYIFADKVAACAQAEALSAGRQDTLVWVDPECLIVQPPDLFELGPDHDAAVRPVHIKNIGLLHTDPLDRYWENIYRLVGVQEPVVAVESFVDRQKIRAYFNSHAFAVDPALGLLQRWAELFEILVTDDDFQQSACQDRLHQIFLFQAVLSSLLVNRVNTRRMRILPASYNYPYNLHLQIPRESRAQSFNELITLVWEGRSLAPDLVSDIGIEEPLRTWLASRDLPG